MTDTDRTNWLLGDRTMLDLQPHSGYTHGQLRVFTKDSKYFGCTMVFSDGAAYPLLLPSKHFLTLSYDEFTLYPVARSSFVFLPGRRLCLVFVLEGLGAINSIRRVNTHGLLVRVLFEGHEPFSAMHHQELFTPNSWGFKLADPDSWTFQVIDKENSPEYAAAVKSVRVGSPPVWEALERPFRDFESHQLFSVE